MMTETAAADEIDRGKFDVIGTLRRSPPPYGCRRRSPIPAPMLLSGGLTSRLARLEKAGLIAREPSAEDGRSIVACLTQKGVRIAVAAFRTDIANELDLLRPLDRPSARRWRLLRKLMTSLRP